MAQKNESDPGDIPDEVGYSRRSRGGCWTCKRLHRKCDEQRPTCRHCEQFQRHCEGYGVRITWVETNHVKKTPYHKKRKTSTAASNHDVGVSTPIQKEDGLCLQVVEDHIRAYTPTLSNPDSNSLVLSTSAELIPDVVENALEARLLTDFESHGHQTMCRTLGPSPMLENIVPLSWQSRSVARACLAFQAYFNPNHRHHFSDFLTEALELFKRQLRNNDIQADEVLATGLLICSVSITTVLLWTTHLKGLEAIITERGNHDPNLPRNDLIQFLVEGVGLLDLPGITIGRRNASRKIWQRFVTPTKSAGIEPTAGLPRSLIDIIAHLDSPEAETELLLWTPSEEVENILQYHLWEANRLAMILITRALRPLTKSSSISDDPHTPTSLPRDTESLIIRIQSCIHSLRDAVDDPFRIPLYLCTLCPMFIAALHADSGSSSRNLVAKDFDAFVERRNHPTDRLAQAVLLEVWSQRDLDPTIVPYEVAQNFAHDMGVELHLY